MNLPLDECKIQEKFTVVYICFYLATAIATVVYSQKDTVADQFQQIWTILRWKAVMTWTTRFCNHASKVLSESPSPDHRLIHLPLIKSNISYNCGNALQIQQQLNSPNALSARKRPPPPNFLHFSQSLLFFTSWLRANSTTLNRSIQERFLKSGIIKDQ